VLRNLLLRPFVVLNGADDELHFISRHEVRNVLPTIARDFATAWALEIHDAAHARIDRRDVMRAAGFEEHGEAVVAKLLHQRERIWLEQRLTAGEFDEREPGIANLKRLSKPAHFRQRTGQQLFAPLGERIRRIAVGTAEVARGEPDKHARQPGKGAFPLQAQVDFVDDQRVGHRLD
jgi:hypothetical protein